jgi:uncharacterized membrane protein YraQ (UPF0718 family)
MILFTELAFLFLGVSFLVSWIQQVVPEDKIKNILSQPRGWRGYVDGTGLGSLTPFCSCSTIPIFVKPAKKSCCDVQIDTDLKEQHTSAKQEESTNQK